MKVAIFETEHFEGAFPVIKLFDIPGNEITVYTSPETHKRFLDLFGDNSRRYHWAILPGKKKVPFFTSLYKQLKKNRPDLLYINTISNNHLLYAAVLQLLHLNRTVLTVHDINCLFDSQPSLNFRKAMIHSGKKRLVKRINEFNVVADTMTPYLQTKTNGKKSHNIPGAVFEHRYSPQLLNGPIRIVVPGSLDKRRRNYEQVFELARLAGENRLNVQIVLLGGYMDNEGKSIVEQADVLKSEFCRVICYHSPLVEQSEFDRQMDAAHFVFIPSVIHTHICGDIPETYGITKSSGNIFDVIKHAKPFIIPDQLTISADLQTSCFRYKAIPDIIDFLKHMISAPADYDIWQVKALENSKNYTIEKVRARNAALFI